MDSHSSKFCFFVVGSTASTTTIQGRKDLKSMPASTSFSNPSTSILRKCISPRACCLQIEAKVRIGTECITPDTPEALCSSITFEDAVDQPRIGGSHISILPSEGPATHLRLVSSGLSRSRSVQWPSSGSMLMPRQPRS
ncbi:hypothetical protein SDC9_62631 [bioreactor metagenome]|uniref:Uncharacterized protein n=1 Tax=bioreactor metagenome TaxID=1076179 RepID=A0A644XPS6_9ZZZZ